MKCIEAIGFDPGSVFMGVGGIRFFGLLDVTDEEGVVLHSVPNIEIVAMERWDLKRGLITKPTEDLTQMRKVRVRVGTNGELPEKSEKMSDWCESVANMVARSDWMFQTHESLIDGGARRLPVLLVESQCDMKKTEYVKTEMLQLVGIISASVLSVDSRKVWQTEDKTTLPMARIACQGMTKYGQRSDASRERVERKQQAVDDMKQLLTQLNTENSKAWLKWLLHMERIKEQIHDMCDGVLSAVHKCEKLYEESIRDEIRQKKALIKRIPYAPMRPRKQPKFKNQVDDPDDVETPSTPVKEKKKREKKTSSEPKAKRKRVEKIVEEEEEPVKKKGRIYPMLLVDVSGENDDQ
jgi:hypothetical protein